jgi:hypothetical protein
MENENKPIDWLDKARAEREAQEKTNAETARLLEEMKNLEARRILSGEATLSKDPEPKKPVSNVEYYEAAKKGIILE